MWEAWHERRRGRRCRSAQTASPHGCRAEGLALWTKSGGGLFRLEGQEPGGSCGGPGEARGRGSGRGRDVEKDLSVGRAPADFLTD